MDFAELIGRIELQSLRLKRAKVEIVYLFGSYAEGTYTLRSDIDLGIVFGDFEVVNGNSFLIYDEIYRILYDVFPGNQEKMDIVLLERASLELQFDAITHGKVVYGASSDLRLEYEERVLSLYADFYPILEEANQAVLERI